MRAVNLDTYSLSLLTAKEDILNGRTSTDWALFTYDGITNNLKLFDSGSGGLAELVERFHIAKPMYGLCRVSPPDVEQLRIILICWVGEDVDELRRTECASHVPAVRNFFREAHAFINTTTKDELTEEKVNMILAKVQPSMERFRRNSRATENEETVGTNYRKTNAALEMRRINRDTFWERAEREEEERKDEEKRKAAEDRRRRERERVMQEKKDAEERDRKMNEKLQMIEEQRKTEAQLQEEARRNEKSRWEQQKREHEEEMRARLRRSESIEKAAEAAALISQRSMNPREFFRQLSSTSSQISSSPTSPRSGKPMFRRYQRSLTDTAFIFERANSFSDSTSPISPSVTSPFSRTLCSPFNRPLSPTSPSFRPVTSPRTPVRSPPISPAQWSAPPVASPPSPPVSKPPPPKCALPDLPAVEEPGSPVLTDLTESRSPNQDVNQQEPAAIPDTPTAPLPESPVRSNEYFNTSKLLDFERKVDEEVLFEEDEEEEEPQPERVPSSGGIVCGSYPDVREPEQELRTGFVVSALVEVDEEEPTEQEEAEQTEHLYSDSAVEQSEPEEIDGEELTLVDVPDDEIDEDLEADMEISMVTPNHAVIEDDCPDLNGGHPQNGTAKEYDDSSENSTPDRCTYIVNRTESDSDEEEEQLENTENGESSDRTLVSVRALYDYQADGETELSFRSGELIEDVETVNKAWLKGRSKDGRQVLFPANFVEII